jgi:hypothetical protein
MGLLLQILFIIFNLQKFSLCLLGFLLVPGGIIASIYFYRSRKETKENIPAGRFDPWLSFEIELAGYGLCFGAFIAGISLILVNCFC